MFNSVFGGITGSLMILTMCAVFIFILFLIFAMIKSGKQSIAIKYRLRKNEVLEESNHDEMIKGDE